MVVVSPSSYTYTGGKITPTYAVVDGVIALYKEGKTPNSAKDEYREISITDAVNVGTGKSQLKVSMIFILEKQLELSQLHRQTLRM